MAGRSWTPWTSAGRESLSERPARSGEIVRKSSSTRPAPRRAPNALGPPSERIRSCPRERRAVSTLEMVGPESPTSCYLVEADDPDGRPWRILLDLGSGALGPLQKYEVEYSAWWLNVQ